MTPPVDGPQEPTADDVVAATEPSRHDVERALERRQAPAPFAPTTWIAVLTLRKDAAR